LLPPAQLLHWDIGGNDEDLVTLLGGVKDEDLVTLFGGIIVCEVTADYAQIHYSIWHS
jgi:hypothetical protein